MRTFLRKLFIAALWTGVLHLAVLAVIVNTTRRPIAYNGMTFTNVPNNHAFMGHSLLRYREADRTRDIDVLFLGSSLAYRGLDPRWFAEQGLKTFNLGSSGQTPINTDYLSEAYLETMDPELVVIEVFSENLRASGLEPLTDHLHNRGVTPDVIRATVAVGGIRAWNALLAQAVSRHQWTIDTRDLEYRANNGLYVPGGSSRWETDDRAPRTFEIEPRPFPSEQIHHLERLVERVVEQGRRCVLVHFPITPAALEEIEDIATFRGIVRRIAHRHGAGLYDFNERSEWDDVDLTDPRWYYDPTHLNSKGVATFDRILLERLRSDGWLAEIESE